MPRPTIFEFPDYGCGKLSTEEIAGIITAIQSVFLRLRNCLEKVKPLYQAYGLTPACLGIIARDLSEQIEVAIRQHCPSFTKGRRHCDLARGEENWEVKVCQRSGLTINQSTPVEGKNYIVTNYDLSTGQITAIWVLWNAADIFFSPRRSNSNARALKLKKARPNIQVLLGSRRWEERPRIQLTFGL